jgi:methionyl aminopeptidase
MPKDQNGKLLPGQITPTRQVPETIVRPEYVGKPAPVQHTTGDRYDMETLNRIRRASRLAAQALELVLSSAKAGMTTDDLDRIGHDFLISNGAYPSTLGYRGFPKSLCTSLNEVICHGIPDDTILEDGDLVNVDISAYLEGDSDLIKMLEKKVYHEECVSVIESIMNELKQRTWQLRDFIGWEKFIGGQ